MSAATAAPPSKPVVLELCDVAKHYGGVQALRGVSLDLRAGEVHALVGENGAGKSTLVKAIAGMIGLDRGSVEFVGASPAEVAVVHQELSVVPALSVLDNLLLGDPRVGRFYRRAAFRAEAREYLAEVGLEQVSLEARAETLSLAERQLVEIARSLSRRARVTILDEPTATLSDAEIERVFASIERLRDRDHCIVYISHRLREIFRLADRVTTLRNGAVVATQPIAELTPDRLVEQMVGAVPPLPEPRRGQPGPVALAVTELASPGRFADFGLELREGEIVGLVGQLGSGADAVTAALAGLDPEVSGSVAVAGEAVGRPRLGEMRRRGLAYLSASRKDDGLFLGFDVEANLTSGILARLSRLGFVRKRARRRAAEALAGEFSVPPERLRAAASELSGGNQQKVALAKTVAGQARVLLLNEPTRGVDIGARSEIYAELKRLTAAGMAVLCFTSDVSEATELCDRVLTMFRGRVVGAVAVAETSETALLGQILHGGVSPS